MQDQIKSKTIKIGGMTCVNCENRIKDKLLRLTGVEKADISYRKGIGIVVYDTKKITIEEVYSTIVNLDYSVDHRKADHKSGSENMLGLVLMIFAVYLLLQQFGLLRIFNVFPEAAAGMSYGMLFTIGLLTSVHCVAMCGGINLSQCLPISNSKSGLWLSIRPSFLYNAGRVLSYTLVGGIVGALGSVISFSATGKGMIQLIAGIFMVIMGVNMLGVFPWLRRFNLSLPSFLTRKVHSSKSSSPLIVGLFNGLMPCGPLQAMQIYALSTGSPIKGALSMLLFSLGTVPLMFGFGALSSILSRKFAGKVMQAGAVLVIILGFSMFNNGLALSGFGISRSTGNASSQNTVTIEDGIQIINTELVSGRYTPITVTKGLPVRWTVSAAPGTVNGCNNRMIIPEYGIEKRLEIGENVIAFTPEQSGTFNYSCWMGMIRSTITVTESDGSVNSETEIKYTTDYFDEGFIDKSFENIPVLEVAGYEIPTDEIAVGQVIEDRQRVSIVMDDNRFTPSVIVMQAGIETELNIINKSTLFDTLLFPYYYAQLQMDIEDNIIYIYPTEDFEFLTGDSSIFAYVKVVKDINEVDSEAVKEEAANFTTFIQTPDTIVSGVSCH